MSLKNQQQSESSLFSGIRNLLSKFKQSPEIYPIRYYKKSRKFRRNFQVPMVK